MALGLVGCAWSNRDNRPVWNAFEEHLIPDDDVAFAASLPLTIPGGLIAILTDTFVAHPAQVVDDAAGDARDLWDDMRWPDEYYTELVKLPLRGVGTPLVFLGSFLGRSCFDIDEYKHRAPKTPAEEAREQRARQTQVRGWLDSLAAGRTKPLPGQSTAGMPWSDDLQTGFEAARQSANPEGRLLLYRTAGTNAWPPWRKDPALGLRDPDPVVRYLVLESWPRGEGVPKELRNELRNDPNEMVRLSARKAFPGSD